MKKYYMHIIIVVLALFVAGVSVNKRNNQFKYWLKHKNSFFTHGYSSVTTLDAYYWLRQARYYNDGKYDGKHRYFLNSYPDTKGNVLKEPPFISYTLAKLYKFFKSDGYNHLYVGSIKLINLLASLFIIPLILIFYKLGFPSAGVLGSLIATFSWAYYPRSCTGRIDTDSLLLFFPFLAILLTLFIPDFKNRYIKSVLVILTGITLNFYSKWHGVAGSYNFIYSWLFLIFLFLHKEEKKSIIINFILFIIASNPLNFIHGLSNGLGFLHSSYFAAVLHAKSNNIVLPNILSTITETQKKSSQEIINMVFASTPLFWIGFLGFLGLLVKQWKKVFLFLPIFGLGVMSFRGSNRFALFLAPFIGVGLGFLVELIIYYMLIFYKRINKDRCKLYSSVAGIIFVCIMFFSLKNRTAYSLLPGPSINVPTINSFIKLKHILHRNSAVFTWWDYGYCLQEIPEFATYHDGGRHGGVETYLVGKGFTLTDQEKLYNMLSYMEHYKNKGVTDLLKQSINGNYFLDKLLNYTDTGINYPTYILYTGDMIGKYGAISFFGNWDFNQNKSFPDSYSYIRCSSLKNNILYCSNLNINIGSGEIDFRGSGRKAFLKRTVFVNNGYILKNIDYANKNGIYLQLLMKKNNIFQIMLLNNKLFNSNFNQQFILGNIDKRYYREVYNNFPVARVFKVVSKK